jgi:hypothetical protein
MEKGKRQKGEGGRGRLPGEKGEGRSRKIRKNIQ